MPERNPSDLINLQFSRTEVPMAKQLCPDATDARCNGGVRQSLYISVHKFNQKLANSESTVGIAADFSNRIGIGTTDIRINVDDQAADTLCRIPTRAWPVEFVTISWAGL